MNLSRTWPLHLHYVTFLAVLQYIPNTSNFSVNIIFQGSCCPQNCLVTGLKIPALRVSHVSNQKEKFSRSHWYCHLCLLQKSIHLGSPAAAIWIICWRPLGPFSLGGVAIAWYTSFTAACVFSSSWVPRRLLVRCSGSHFVTYSLPWRLVINLALARTDSACLRALILTPMSTARVRRLADTMSLFASWYPATRTR